MGQLCPAQVPIAIIPFCKIEAGQNSVGRVQFHFVLSGVWTPQKVLSGPKGVAFIKCPFHHRFTFKELSPRFFASPLTRLRLKPLSVVSLPSSPVVAFSGL